MDVTTFQGLSNEELGEKQRSLINNHSWQAALAINDIMIERPGIRPKTFWERSRILRNLSRMEEAEAALTVYIERLAGCDIDQILDDVRKPLMQALNDDTLSSAYKVDRSGGFNLGTIEHHSTATGKIYHTKLAPGQAGVSERFFYENVRPKLPDLQPVTLPMISAVEFGQNKFHALTFPLVAGRHIAESDDLNALFNCYQAMAKIKTKSLKSLLPDMQEPRFDFGKLQLSRIFANIHKLDIQRQTFLWVHQFLQTKQKYLHAVKDMAALEYIVSGGRLFKPFATRMEYTLMHGDFHTGNILTDDSGSLALIDWPNFYTGPKGIDLVKVCRRLGWDFDTIREEFLDNKSRNAKMKPREKCAFAFGMILTWINFAPMKSLTEYSSYIGAAFKYIEQLCRDYKLVEAEYISA